MNVNLAYREEIELPQPGASPEEIIRICPPPELEAEVPSSQIILVERVKFIDNLEELRRSCSIDSRLLQPDLQLCGSIDERCEWRLFEFTRELQISAVNEEIRKFRPHNPWEPGRLDHLTAFRLQADERFKQHLIVASGQEISIKAEPRALFDGSMGEESFDVFVPKSFVSHGVRILELIPARGFFPRGFLFLGVRPVV